MSQKYTSAGDCETTMADTNNAFHSLPPDAGRMVTFICACAMPLTTSGRSA